MMLKKTIKLLLFSLFLGFTGSAYAFSPEAISSSATVSISVDQASANEDTPATFVFTFTRTDNDLSEALVIYFDVSGSASLTDDYTVSGALTFTDTEGSVMIPAGVTSTTLTATAVTDSDDEDDETLIITLREYFTIQLEALTATTTEGNTADFTFTLSSPNTTGSSITVTYQASGTAVSGADYIAPSGVVEFAPNQQVVSLTIAITEDGDNTELDETLILSMTSASPTSQVELDASFQSAQVLIDAPTQFDLTVSASQATVTEEVDSFISFIFTLDQANDTGAPLNITYSTTGTAFAGFDYTPAATQTVSIPDGATTATLDLALIDDPYIEKISGAKEFEQLILEVETLPMHVTASVTSVTVRIDDGDAGCTVNTSTTLTSEICFEENHNQDTRKITANGIPDHAAGPFPRFGNPHEIGAQDYQFKVDLTPVEAATFTAIFNGAPNLGGNYAFGIATNGVTYRPAANEPWEELDVNGDLTGELNYDWTYEFTSSLVNLGGDDNDAHPTSLDEYHYHGDPTNFVAGEDGTKHSAIYGFAADGFPIYYKYVYSNPLDSTSSIVEMTASYQIKSGMRPGDGQTEPDGAYDGEFAQDYEYVNGLGDLDEANGRFGVTPEYPNGTYYYVLTGSFPYIPRYFRGTPNSTNNFGFGL
ncbi:MAG: YHYH protein [Bacteroidota bacterium]